MNYKNTWTYQGKIELPTLKGYLFNHGTESKKNTRTLNHINDCKAEYFDYIVLREKSDRLFGTEVIAPSHDSDYIKKLVEDINEHVCKNTLVKAMTWKDFKISLGQMKSRIRGIFDGLEKAKLSETECAFIPDCVSEAMLGAAINRVDKWYYSTKTLRISAKAYKDQTKKEQTMATKPIPRAFHKAILDVARYGKKYIELLNYKFIRVQSLELAYLILTQREFKNIERLRVIITADDKETHKEVYNILSRNNKNNKVELIEYDTDTEVEMEYKNMEYKPDLDIMNPPYDGSLHLVILENVLANKKPNSTVISIQPCRWLEDPLAEYKQNADFPKYKTSIVDKISNFKLILRNDANKAFGINSRANLGIFVFDNKNTFKVNRVGKTIFEKLITQTTLQKYLSNNKINEFSIPVVTHLLNEADGRATSKLIVATDGPIAKRGYINASDAQGWQWLNLATNKVEYDTLVSYLNSKFISNLVKLANTPRSIFNYLPVPPVLNKLYSDIEYCKVFDLDQQEIDILFDSSKWNIVTPEEI